MVEGGESFAALIGQLTAKYAEAITRGEFTTAGLLETQIADLERRAIVRASWQETG